MEPLLSVVIVNYRVKWFLAQTLASVKEALADISHEIWVVDNNSGDDSISYAREKFPEVNFIENKDNTGFAHANNQAIAQATGKYTLILNPDTIVTQEAIGGALEHLENNPECGATGTKMIDAMGKFLPESKRSFPTPWVSFCKIFGLQKLFPNSRRFARYALLYLPADEPHKVEILAGAYIVARTSILKSIGGFDEAFFMYGEDIDLSYRITKAGYYNMYLPLPIVHYKGESTHHDDFRYVKVFYEAMLIFYKKHYPHLSLPFGILIRTGIGLRASLAIAHRMIKRMLPFRKRRTAERQTEPEEILDDSKMTYSEIVKAIADNAGGKKNIGIRSAICQNRIITPKMPQQ